jgi:hypothetical protein
MPGSAEALERFQRQAAIPMLILALASLPLIVLTLLLDLSPTADSADTPSIGSSGPPSRWSM